MNTPLSYFSGSGLLAVALAATVGSAYAQAADTVLMQGAAATITSEDVKADAAARIPVDMHNSVLSKPQAVSQIVSNLYVRRVMAQQAEAKGLGSSPSVMAALQVARDKVLSDAYMAEIEVGHALSDAQAEALARSIYRARPERFKQGERVQVRHILIAGVVPESRAQAQQLLEELKAGADFAAAARERSADKASGAKGGDLGLFEAGKMVPEFDSAAFALAKPGDLSEVVESKFGYHILQLQQRVPAGQKPFDEVREELMREVRADALHKARVAEADRIRGGVQVKGDAVQVFTEGYR